MELLKVTWDDAATDDGWNTDHSLNIERVVSVGWLLDRTNEQIILGADLSMDRNGEYHSNRRIAIPMPWIVKQEELIEV